MFSTRYYSTQGLISNSSNSSTGGGNYSSIISDLVSRLATAQVKIESLQSQVDDINANITAIREEINDIRTKLPIYLNEYTSDPSSDTNIYNAAYINSIGCYKTDYVEDSVLYSNYLLLGDYQSSSIHPSLIQIGNSNNNLKVRIPNLEYPESLDIRRLTLDYTTPSIGNNSVLYIIQDASEKAKITTDTTNINNNKIIINGSTINIGDSSDTTDLKLSSTTNIDVTSPTINIGDSSDTTTTTIYGTLLFS